MRWLIYLGFIVIGVVLFSLSLSMMDLPDMPGDIAYDRGAWHIHVPLLFSLGAVAIAGLIFWMVKR
ncbi:MAG: DUF2905 family protein [Rhizomicrobium sp.]